MTLLIKGMEMPATGGFITLQICGDGTVRVVNKATGGVYIAPTFEEVNGTDERIRASSIPAPHGRLGDLDRLYKHIKAECNIYGKPTIGFEDGNKVLKIIADTRTVIEAEEGK